MELCGQEIIRRQSLQELLKLGINPYPAELFEINASAADIHQHYGNLAGARIARKHVGWYLQQHLPADNFRRYFVSLEDADEQLQALADFFATVT